MKLEERLRAAIRKLHYSHRTEEAYVLWHQQFVRFHGLRHPETMGSAEVEAFLTHLAVNRNVSASTQNQALHALVFLRLCIKDIDLIGGKTRRGMAKEARIGR